MTVTVALAPRMVAMIERECAAAPAVETGGLLVVTPGGQGCATGPGPGAVQTPDRLAWDVAFIVGFLVASEACGAEVLGRWHKHTSPVILASDEDRRSAEAFRAAVGADELVDVIVACDAEDRPIGWSAYLCSAGGYERVHLEIPGGEP